MHYMLYESVKEYADVIVKKINERLKAEEFYSDDDPYFVNGDDKEILGYFIYKKTEVTESDDFYIGKFIYRIESSDIDVSFDIDKSFTTFADVNLYIKNTLKGELLK